MSDLGDREPIDLGPGMAWTWNGQESRFLQFVPVDGQPGALIKRDDEYEQISLYDLAREAIDVAWTTRPGLAEHADDDVLLASLPPDAHREWRRKLRAALTVQTGSPDGVPPLDGRYPPGLDPSVTTVSDRVPVVAAAVGQHPRTIWSWYGELKKSGPTGLVHGNRQVSSPLVNYPSDVVRIAREFVADQLHQTTLSQRNLVGKFNSRLLKLGFDELSGYRAAKLLDEVSRGQSLRGTAKTRKSKASRSKTSGGYGRVAAANEVWEVDAVRMDTMAYSPLSKNGVPIWGIVIIDQCTRVLSIYVTLSPPSARSVALAMHRRICPLRLSGTSIPLELFSGIPEVLDVDEDILCHPGGTPGEIHSDNGREFQNDFIFTLYGQLGIDAVFARPRTGPDKPHVESVNRNYNHFLQLTPGAKGNTAVNRGNPRPGERLFSRTEHQWFADAFCATHNNKPHPSLRHPLELGRCMTPLDKHHASLMAGAKFRISPDPNLLFQFLATSQAVASGQGPTMDGIVYTSRNLEVMRVLSAGDQHVKGRPLTLHYDPNDRSTVYWHEPGTARWHALNAVGEHGEALPPLSDSVFLREVKAQARRAPTKPEGYTVARIWVDAIERMRDDPTARRVLRDEYNRYQERIRPDQLVEPQSAESSAVPSLTIETDVPETPSVLRFDIDAYLDELDAPDEEAS